MKAESKILVKKTDKNLSDLGEKAYLKNMFSKCNSSYQSCKSQTFLTNSFILR